MSKRYYKIQGIVEVPNNVSFTKATDEFLRYLQARNSTFGGKIVEVDKEGNEIQSID